MIELTDEQLARIKALIPKVQAKIAAEAKLIEDKAAFAKTLADGKATMTKAQIVALAEGYAKEKATEKK